MSTVSGAGILPRPAGKSCFAGKSLPATGRRPAPRSTLHEREEDWLPASCAHLPRGPGFSYNGQP